MAVFSCLELIACIKLSVKDETTAHTGSYKETDNILVALCSTELILTENTYVNVVADIERAAEFSFYWLSDVVVLPGKIGREKDNACLLIDNSGSACRNGMDIALLDALGVYKLFCHVDDNFFDILR